MKKIIENTVRLSVRDLVEFVLRSGDIDNRHTGRVITDAMLSGSQAHRRIQKSQGLSYTAEVALSGTFPLNGGEAYLTVEGRADGVIQDYPYEVPNEENEVTETLRVTAVDEIKGIYRDITLLEEPEKVHLAQAEVYAYLLSVRDSLPEVAVRVTYVQLEEEEKGNILKAVPDKTSSFSYYYTFEQIEERFFRYVSLYEKWVLFVVRHRKKRKESASGFPFPYEYRPGQKKIVSCVYRAEESGKKLFVQAPTGIGKTLAMLYPSVQAVGQDLSDKIFYLTAKTVTAKAAEDGMQLMTGKGLSFNYVKITAKEKQCPQDETICDPEHCSRAKGHFDRVNEAVFDLITHETAISTETIRAYADRYEVCPYELSLDVSYYTDVIICDYNYVFAPHVYLQRYFADKSDRDYILLIDEAHNLADRARDMYSASLVKEDVLAAKKLFEGQKTILKHLEKINKLMLALKRECDRYTVFGKDEFPNALLYELTLLREALSRYLDHHRNIPKADEVLDFFFKVSDFLDTADVSEEGYISYASFLENGSFFIKLFCIDPSVRLKEHLELVRSTVFFSATFLPVNYYKELLAGNKTEDAVYVDSPFDPAKRTLLLVRDVSTKYTRRGETEYERIASYLLRMAGEAPGNYMAFFPSHSFLSEVKSALYRLLHRTEEEPDADVRILSQKKVMSEEERSGFLSAFSEEQTKTLIGLCVMGGVFSEGIDLRKDRLIGVAVVGTGLPQVCTERELMRAYYTKKGENGFDYAYRFPGFNKVMQAAGRLIRTDEDYGVIALMDERFAFSENLKLFPKEWSDYRIVSGQSFDEAVRHFWRWI